ncbi:MAG: alanyl-tRNA editing protein [Litorilinea sp.]
MTELLYYTDAYQHEFDATLAGVAADSSADTAFQITLDRTAFYPGGGGQPADTGSLTIAGPTTEGLTLPVSKVKRAGADLVHTVTCAPDQVDAAARALQTGSAVHGALDWDRRYQIMRTHTAMHILCGVVWRDYGASVTGGNMDPGAGRMDFEFAALSRELIGEIEFKCNAEIAAARPVSSKILPRAEAFAIPDLIRTKINLLPEGIREVRIVELAGLDLQADGGTHVHNTSEVGAMRIVDYKSKGAINKRVYIELGEVATPD